LTAVQSAIAAAPSATSAIKQTVALLKDGMPDYTWVGVYLLDGNELVLGPYVGKPSPHTRIPLGRGICGAAAAEKATIVVDDVNADPRYLACSVDTKYELVVPIMQGREVLGEIDSNSDSTSALGYRDRDRLEAIAWRCSPTVWRTTVTDARITLIPGDGIGPRSPRPSSTSSNTPDCRSSGIATKPASSRSRNTVSRCPRRCSTPSAATRSR
jgi:GAF domain-containing protein